MQAAACIHYREEGGEMRKLLFVVCVLLATLAASPALAQSPWPEPGSCALQFGPGHSEAGFSIAPSFTELVHGLHTEICDRMLDG